MRAETIIAEKYGPLPDAPAPVAAYVPVTQSGRIVWCSGQLPVRNGEKPYVGRLGAEVSAQDGYAAAQLCALNLLAQLKKHLETWTGSPASWTRGSTWPPPRNSPSSRRWPTA